MKKVLLIGASGLIGTALQKNLSGYDFETFRGRDILNKDQKELSEIISGYEVIINLAGKSIFTLWTRKNKQTIYDSRVKTVKRLVEAINNSKNPPAHFINASAIGIYKPEVLCDESTGNYADNFLAKVVKDWETEAENIQNQKTFTTILRIGIVMSRKGGAYKTLRLLTRLNLGAYFNGGKQSLSFISINDLTNAVDFIIKKNINGKINLVSPEITNYLDLMKKMKKKLNAVLIWPLPGFIMKLLFGEASLLFLEGHKIRPGVLIRHGFKFETPDIESCIQKMENN